MRLDELMKKGFSATSARAAKKPTKTTKKTTTKKTSKASKAAKKRPVSPMQQAYRDFFRMKLEEFGVASPAALSEADKKQFFNEIKAEWPKEKRKVQRLIKKMGAAASAEFSSLSSSLSFDFNYNKNFEVISSTFVTFSPVIPASKRASSLKTTSSALSNAYNQFFRDKLAEFGVSSPADMDDETAKQFFNEIKAEWPRVKAEL